MFKNNPKISIIGLGYVGLPLALEFSKHFKVVGFDTKKERVDNLNKGKDSNFQFNKKEIYRNKIKFTYQDKYLKDTDIFIITVPTPLKKNNKPDLGPLLNATKLIEKHIKKNCIFVYESTVYPGCIEENCLPILKKNNKTLNKHFFLGYSPERINVGDNKHKLTNIKKIVSGSTIKTSNYLAKIYGKIISVGIHIAPSIKVAEAAKVIENTQRDLNIAFFNELSKIFSNLKIDTNEVIRAASTKWNFIPFSPGLVGGHCIGVDPYYLTYKARQSGFNPKIILAGRKTNDSMAKYVAKKFDHEFKKIKLNKKKKIIIFGLTFKEDCNDLRNSKVFDVIKTLKKLNYKFDIHDPWINKNDLEKKFQKYYINKLKKNIYVGAMLLVPHGFYLKNWKIIKKSLKKDSIIFDLKNRLKLKNNFLKL